MTTEPSSEFTRGTIDLEGLRGFFEREIAFNAHLGLRVTRLERGLMEAELPFRPELLGDPGKQALHGGVTSMLADTVGGGAVFSLTDPGDQVATIDLSVAYLRPGRPEPVRAEGVVVRMGLSVCVSTVTLRHPGRPDQPIAMGKGVYTIRRARR